MIKSEEMEVNAIRDLWLRLVRSHLIFHETDKPEKSVVGSSFRRLASRAMESAGLGQAERRRWPMRRAAEGVSG
jgi:hypothetical protein